MNTFFEEKDLENAIKSIDIKSLPLPNEIVQNKFKLAARNFMKDETKMKAGCCCCINLYNSLKKFSKNA
jgi:hypothetical protein